MLAAARLKLRLPACGTRDVRHQEAVSISNLIVVECTKSVCYLT